MRHPYFTPDVVDILTAYAVDYIVPIVALAQATGRTTLKDYDIGVTVHEPRAHDGTATVAIRIGTYRLARTLKYDLDAADKFFDNLRTLASLARNAFISLPGHWPWLGFSGRFGLHNRFVNVHLGLRIPNRRRLTDGHYWEIHSEWATRRSALIARMRRHFDVVEAGVFPMNRYHYFFRCQGSQHLG